MNEGWKQLVLDNTQATDARKIESVQSLWSGYGEIFRVQLVPETLGTVIVKAVSPPIDSQHPRGWNTDRSLERKLISYEVEVHWYMQWAHRCNQRPGNDHLHNETGQCRVPACIASLSDGAQSWIILEDLDASGFDIRHSSLTEKQAKPCLEWLAQLHARFLHSEPTGLWPIGTYWHLDTRPDEYSSMPEGSLKDCAVQLDALLNNCKYQSIVHGDAKVANFCFNSDSTTVAAVDFQYVGGGCGMKDVAYFFGSCFDEHECERLVPSLLDYYFDVLRECTNNTIDKRALEQEWRALFAPAWTDFYRFLLGWMPSGAARHKKMHGYTEKLAQQTLAQL